MILYIFVLVMLFSCSDNSNQDLLYIDNKISSINQELINTNKKIDNVYKYINTLDSSLSDLYSLIEEYEKNSTIVLVDSNQNISSNDSSTIKVNYLSDKIDDLSRYLSERYSIKRISKKTCVLEDLITKEINIYYVNRDTISFNDNVINRKYIIRETSSISTPEYIEFENLRHMKKFKLYKKRGGD